MGGETGTGRGSGERDALLRASWEANAEAWTDAVRNARIPSRAAGTDAAILAAARAVLAAAPARRVLDVGCGEGWLARALAADGATVLGVDGSGALVDAARAAARAAGSHLAGGDAVRFAGVSYEELVRDPSAAAGPWDLVVCNFALLGDPLAPLLGALGDRLADGGRLLVQTVHPWAAAGDGRYESGWRVETFDAFARPFPSPMPWFARTLASWLGELAAAGLAVVAADEPVHPETGRPLSLLLHCARCGRPAA